MAESVDELALSTAADVAQCNRVDLTESEKKFAIELGRRLISELGLKEPKQSAKQEYDKCMEGLIENDPIERLRFFLSIAIKQPQDWLDVEPFIDALSPPLAPECVKDAKRPKIVCLCGSTRFKAAFEEVNYQETMAGHIVLSVGVYMHASGNRHKDGIGATPEQKIVLDELHKRKIEFADEVLILNVDGALP